MSRFVWYLGFEDACAGFVLLMPQGDRAQSSPDEYYSSSWWCLDGGLFDLDCASVHGTSIRCLVSIDEWGVHCRVLVLYDGALL